MVIKPVVDLVGQRIQSFYPDLSVERAYNKIPICAAELHRWIACPRLHQLVYNEIVDIIELDGQEAKIRIPNLFYITTQTKEPQQEYWAPANAFISCDTLHKDYNIDMRIFPEPISLDKKTIFLSPHIVTLIMPYHDIKTGFTFSAGTRFMRVYHKKDERKECLSVSIYDPHIKKMRIIHIPHSYCFVPAEQMSTDAQRKLFVELVRSWAYIPEGFIPYVWGGCSIVYTQTGGFKEKIRKQADKKVAYFAYEKKNRHRPHTGVDCSGLIARAAQAVGIPYFYKNSYTLSEYMKPLTPGNHLQNGDLIWMPGHCMIVSDDINNLVIEARSYFSGYGKLHEIDISNVFKDIQTLDELEQAFFAKKAINRLDSSGEITHHITEYKLLPLQQLWD